MISCSTRTMRICTTIKGPAHFTSQWRRNRKSFASGDGFVWNDGAKSNGSKGILCSLTRPPNHRLSSPVHAALIKRMTGYATCHKAFKKERQKEMRSQRNRDFHDRTRCKTPGICILSADTSSQMYREMKDVLTSRNQSLIEFKFEYLG